MLKPSIHFFCLNFFYNKPNRQHQSHCFTFLCLALDMCAEWSAEQYFFSSIIYFPAFSIFPIPIRSKQEYLVIKSLVNYHKKLTLSLASLRNDIVYSLTLSIFYLLFLSEFTSLCSLVCPENSPFTFIIYI